MCGGRWRPRIYPASAKVRHVLPSLCEGGFVERAENLLAFGLPGTGKSHTLCAVGHELVQSGYKVLFTPAYRLLQRLVVAKHDLALEEELRRLYSHQSPLAARCEPDQGSITSK